MGQINWGRVLLGGIVAGIIIDAGEFVLYGVVRGQVHSECRPPLDIGSHESSAVRADPRRSWRIGVGCPGRTNADLTSRSAVNCTLAQWT